MYTARESWARLDITRPFLPIAIDQTWWVCALRGPIADTSPWPPGRDGRYRQTRQTRQTLITVAVYPPASSLSRQALGASILSLKALIAMTELALVIFALFVKVPLVLCGFPVGAVP